MLIRFLVKNLFSFKKLTEFNMLPGRATRLPNHVYKHGGVEALKLNAIYGANGAGKSNLIRALNLLKRFVVLGEMRIEFITQTFKLDKESSKKDVYLGIEFIKDEVPYYYGITINQGIVVEEELQISGLGDKEDMVLFSRTDSSHQKNLSVVFSKEVNEDKEASQFPAFLQNEMLERNKPVLFYMKNRQNAVFNPIKKALEWIGGNLITITPDGWPGAMEHWFELNKSYSEFANSLMKKLGTGVASIHIETIPIENVLGRNNIQEIKKITAELNAKPQMPEYWYDENNDEEIAFVLEKDKVVAKKIVFTHNEDRETTRFKFVEESDGTRKLMEYLPVLYLLIRFDTTFVIDEIERSIHPILIKELIKKISEETQTKGQLIFSTHESNLLDQDIFRTDEIWFAEKNKEGATELYPLSDFKEHHTIDIRKGYLSGRYGAIPFMGNLKDLNWDKYAEAD